jgi:hypothetical protein
VHGGVIHPTDVSITCNSLLFILAIAQHLLHLTGIASDGCKVVALRAGDKVAILIPYTMTDVMH